MKGKILKVIGISFLVFVVLSWIIPVGTYSNGSLTTNDVDPVGLIDLFTQPVIAFANFAIYGAVFAAIGGFYGVMEKTGALDKVTDWLKIRFEKRGKLFLALTVVFFAVLSSVTGLILPLFLLVPLFAAALFKMDYDKVTVLASTVGALLVGSIGSTLGFNISGYTKNMLYLEDMFSEMWAKVILLVLLVAGLILVVLLGSKKRHETVELATENASLAVKSDVKEVSKKEEKVENVEAKPTKKTAKAETKASAKKTEKATAETKAATKKATSKTTKTTKKTTSKTTTTRGRKPGRKTNTKGLAIAHDVKKIPHEKQVSGIPFVVILILTMIVAVLGMYDWSNSFGISVFTDLYNNIMNIKIGDFPIFEHLFSGSSEFGRWTNYDFVALVIFASMLIAWLYRLKVNEYIESFIDGVKKWIPTAAYVILAFVVCTVVLQQISAQTGTMVDTINSKIFELSDGFNVIFTGAASLIGSFCFNDLYYLLYDMYAFIGGYDATILPIAGLLVQAVYGVAMLIFPTSVVLIAGLSLFNVSYKQWMKYIWKFALIAFLLVLLVCGILTLL